MRERILAALIAVLVVGGVIGVATDDGGGEPSEAAGPALVAAVETRVGDVLAYVNGGVGDPEELFSPGFLAAVPLAELEALVRDQLRPAGPFRVARVVDASPTTAVLEIAGAAGTVLRMSIAVDELQPHRITGLLFTPVASTVSSWAELDAALLAAAPDVAFLAAEIVGGECRPVHATDPDRVLPLGSAFKLYVLGAVADAVAAGSASWDEPIEIRDDLRVHTSMTFGTTPAGTKVSLRDLSSAMIEVSDNTATDHVMERIGREAVEAEQAVLGLADPARNLPFLTTRELTLLKFLGSEGERAAYIADGVDGRRARLEALPARGVSDDEIRAVLGAPVALDSLEWFASPSDLCRAHVGLRERGDVVRSILTANPGAGLDRDRWPSIAFKGGSEPGVLALSWSADRADGRTFFVGVLLKNDAGPVAVDAAVDAAKAFDLLSGE